MPLLAVIIGGLVGTGLRLGIDALLPHGDDGFPWSTLVINVIGAFALGSLVARFWATAAEWLRAGLGVGLLGSFTTFSALAVSFVALADAGEWATAVGYLIATMVAGLAAAWAGIAAFRRRGTPLAGPEVEE